MHHWPVGDFNIERELVHVPARLYCTFNRLLFIIILLCLFWVTASKERPFSESCENCSTLSPPHLGIPSDSLNRYSNTFLVSLNSRIRIRGATTAEVVNRNPAMTLAVIPQRSASPLRWQDLHNIHGDGATFTYVQVFGERGGAQGSPVNNAGCYSVLVQCVLTVTIYV
jgi:hypothetical protein